MGNVNLFEISKKQTNALFDKIIVYLALILKKATKAFVLWQPETTLKSTTNSHTRNKIEKLFFYNDPAGDRNRNNRCASHRGHRGRQDLDPNKKISFIHS